MTLTRVRDVDPALGAPLAALCERASVKGAEPCPWETSMRRRSKDSSVKHFMKMLAGPSDTSMIAMVPEPEEVASIAMTPEPKEVAQS